MSPEESTALHRAPHQRQRDIGQHRKRPALRQNRNQCVIGLGGIVANQSPCESRGLPGRWRTNGGPWESHGIPWCVRPPLDRDSLFETIEFLGFFPSVLMGAPRSDNAPPPHRPCYPAPPHRKINNPPRGRRRPSGPQSNPKEPVRVQRNPYESVGINRTPFAS